MDTNALIDSWLESKSINVTSESRIEVLIVLFYWLKTQGIAIPDITESVYANLLNKFKQNFASEYLNSLNMKFIHADVKQAVEAVLDLERKKIEVPKKVDIIFTDIGSDYDEEKDVLEEEGYMEPPVRGPDFYDIEYAKLLGIHKDE